MNQHIYYGTVVVDIFTFIVYPLYYSVIELSNIKYAHSIVDNFLSSLECKLQCSPHGHGSIIPHATTFGQVLSANWGFVCQNHLSSFHGDSSYYIIFTCAFTGTISWHLC